MGNIETLQGALERYRKAKGHYRKSLERYRAALSNYQSAKEVLQKIASGRVANYYSRSGIGIDIPFVPSTNQKVEIMMELLGKVEGKRAADLGSGDGKVIIALSERGALAHGYELEPTLAEQARRSLEQKGFKEAGIIEADFFDWDLSPYDVITVYGISSMMSRLEKKLLSELNSGSLIVSNTFPFPTWKPIQESRGVYLYRKE